MSRAVINSVLGDNSYLLSIPGYDTTFPAQCITQDELTQNQEVEVVDIDNLPPHKALQYGKLRCMPNQGEYTYTPERTWLGHEDMKDFYPATLARSFFYSSEKNPRWQESCPLYRRGTVTEVIDEKYMRVKVWSSPIFEGASLVGIKCRTDYMSCDTAAFSEDDDVVVKFEDSCPEKPVVVGFWDDPPGCGWRFKITRGDGLVLDDENVPYVSFIVYDSSQTFIFPSASPVYSGGYWSFDFAEEQPLGGDPNDPNGYWVEVYTYHSIHTQYPFEYKDDDMFQSENLIPVGTYEMEVPLWHTENNHDAVDNYYLEDETYNWPSTLAFSDDWCYALISLGNIREGHYTLFGGNVVSRYIFRLTVYSSIPYEVRYVGEAKTAFPTGDGYLFHSQGGVFLDNASYTLDTDNGDSQLIQTSGVGMLEYVEYEANILGNDHWIKLTPNHNGSYKFVAIKQTIAYITLSYNY